MTLPVKETAMMLKTMTHTNAPCGVGEGRQGCQWPAWDASHGPCDAMAQTHVVMRINMVQTNTLRCMDVKRDDTLMALPFVSRPSGVKSSIPSDINDVGGRGMAGIDVVTGEGKDSSRCSHHGLRACEEQHPFWVNQGSD